MIDISVKVFVSKKDVAVEMIDSWREEFDHLKNIHVEMQVIDFDSNPDEIEKNDIIFSPTTFIQLPEGKTVRFIGYTKNILTFLKAYSIKIQTEMDREKAEEFIERSRDMKKEASKMKKFQDAEEI